MSFMDQIDEIAKDNTDGYLFVCVIGGWVRFQQGIKAEKVWGLYRTLPADIRNKLLDFILSKMTGRAG